MTENEFKSELQHVKDEIKKADDHFEIGLDQEGNEILYKLNADYYFDWLIETVEHQQTRIQELETIEKAYEALKKAL